MSMMAQNGGVIWGDGDEWNLHPIWDKSDKKRLKRTSNDVVRETKAMANWIGWPDSECYLYRRERYGRCIVFLKQLKNH